MIALLLRPSGAHPTRCIKLCASVHHDLRTRKKKLVSIWPSVGRSVTCTALSTAFCPNLARKVSGDCAVPTRGEGTLRTALRKQRRTLRWTPAPLVFLPCTPNRRVSFCRTRHHYPRPAPLPTLAAPWSLVVTPFTLLPRTRHLANVVSYGPATCRSATTAAPFSASSSLTSTAMAGPQ
jgi:hypothetical protein